MPRFSPFQGLRYDPAVIALAQVIAPPYDVIEPADRMRLATRSTFNSVHLELPDADLRAGLDRYQVAAHLLSAWQADGVLVLDDHPAFYLYRMTDGEGRATLGVIGALGLPEDGEDGDNETGTDGAVDLPSTSGNQQAKRWSGEPTVRSGGSDSRHLSWT